MYIFPREILYFIKYYYEEIKLCKIMDTDVPFLFEVESNTVGFEPIKLRIQSFKDVIF